MTREFGRFFHRPGNRFVNRFLVGEAVRIPEPSLTWKRLCAEYARKTAASLPDMFIKMDIEGAEYAVLPEVLADASRLNGMAIEFHDLETHWREFTDLMARLDEHFAIAHIHGNNFRPLIAGSTTPSVLELSLVNRTLLSAPASPNRAAYPLPELDMPNDATKPDFRLDL